MSLSLVRPYFKKQAEALNYKEHDGPFDSNLPGVLGSRTFVLQMGSVKTTKLDQRSIQLECDVDIELYSSTTGRDSSRAVDTAILDAETYITSIMKVSNRLNTLKNVFFSSLSVEPINEKNKNSVVSKMSFTASVVLEL